MVLGTIEEAGVGGTALAVYTYALLEISPINLGYRPQLLYSIVPIVVLVLLIDSFNDPIMKRIAGKEFLSNVHDDVRDEVGDEQFYYDHEDKQEKIDDLDKKSVGRVVNIIVGVVMSLTLPVIGFIRYEILGAVVGILIGIAVAYVLVIRQRSKLRNIISELSRLY
ncbi:hypothetical protein ACFQJ7_11710 [Halovenus rubra]|uniref:Uncharacterized protein n=2 Tax=Halovenus rubra TaxID=869890 RepID=A0ACC7E0P8_9EURY|nr:hypothetical protein [Halovenus rubra]